MRTGSWRGRSDHPRIRGEHKCASSCPTTTSGSSPHTRGARHHHEHRVSALGIIPAYAGSTSGQRSEDGSPPDHPRIRGEHLILVPHGYLPRGSSPHTRGARQRPAHAGDDHGIIPAYAGSTFLSHPFSVSSTDHPRIRGEHNPDPLATSRWGGSSPHTRGALGLGGASRIAKGIIPAYAGSTSAAAASCRRLWDHPRIRGEHGVYVCDGSLAEGSSPHTRGARGAERVGQVGRGIIPAYAGSTVVADTLLENLKDHPRIRGEHAPGARARRQRKGSSPHTRGALR